MIFRALSKLISDLRWRSLMRPLDRRERQARRRNDCRAIGRVQRERRELVHAALRRCA